MSRRNDSSRRHRKSRAVKNDHEYPLVSFDGGVESYEIPADEGKSPVHTRLSQTSTPGEVKYMDEIALLKRGRIDKDAPKHPYNRRGQPPPISELSIPSPLPTKSPGLHTVMNGVPDATKSYKVGSDGELKYSTIKGGGERYELSSDKQFTCFQQTAGETCLFTFRD
ncbi:Protein CBG06801 [Caenorhabditis briggsae]|uniref:Uncharacterized protein n=3 Tax=Caenorhabditis TaxID=6237 RepID=A0AAE9IR31_CAEBR|nr:Protein CBG06801 [Caenorhabditis briggsae]PIC39145.1 hypothetical protein B9Z55_010926 [Caenorhabditis nigoni]ULU02155.1 hypothetical protein L3Y34_002015 [Caenorhabditis briggsae]UMM24775.1 hypothetical protein L5515_004850 [Caenorhabditis briggsae]CAP27050.1 Protein CBG06801 [Caenorhabditis briggsae]